MKNYKKMTHEELLGYVEELQNRKKYGLVWEDKPEDVVEQCKEMLPVLEEVSDRAIEKNTDGVTNLLIEGDNYHALSVLNYTHAGKIDVIYIDPPYNTGAKDWKYNNDYVDSEDRYRHSKWISFMHKRIGLAKNLLHELGILVVTIDNYEVHNLRHILEEVFPNKEVVMTVIEHNHRGRAKYNFALTHEYALWVLPQSLDIITKKNEMSSDAVLNLRRTGQNSLKADRPSMFYAILVDENLEIIGVSDPLDSSKELKTLKLKKGVQAILPIDNDGTERRWYYGAKRVIQEAQSKTVWAKKNRDKVQIYFKFEGKPKRRKSVWTGAKYDSSSHGTVLLNSVLGKDVFSFPKSLWAVKECLASASGEKNAIVLDFFAGSGTTAHAVLELNKEDGGNRQFILCTNNENNNGNGNVGIAEGVTYPRVKNVIDGYADVEGIPANLRYFKTAFVKQTTVSDDTRRELVKKSTEMICVKESTYKKVYDNKKYKVYKNNEHITGILFDLDSIKEFKEKIDGSGIPAHLYIFSLSNDTFSDDFSSLEVEHTLCPIPESILEVYRKLFA